MGVSGADRLESVFSLRVLVGEGDQQCEGFGQIRCSRTRGGVGADRKGRLTRAICDGPGGETLIL